MKTLRPASTSQFAAYIGLDCSDGKHDVCLQPAEGSARLRSGRALPEAIDEWARKLRTHFGGKPVAIALELEKGPIVYALRKYDFIVLFPINPASLSKYREVFTHSGAKDDPTDVAPVTARSGNSCWVHWRWSCPTFLRQTLVEWAASTIPRSFWAAAFYRQQRGAGKTHQAALRALAYKWIRILHHCWKTRQVYDESIYLNSLEKRGSPLLKFIAKTDAHLL